MNPQDALTALTTTPDDFIRHYPIQIAGYAGAHLPGGATQVTLYLNKREAGLPGRAPDRKEGHMGATKPTLGGLRQQHISSWSFDTVNSNGAIAVPTLSVPMVNYNSPDGVHVNLHGTVTNMGKYILDASADVMITGMLSGCCFCWKPHGANLACTHVRPLAGVNGIQLHNTIDANGSFLALPGPISTFGRNDYPAYATVIGIRSGGNWRLYAQTSADQMRTINASFRLHPGPLTQL